jgi:hypothetical protein
MTAMIGRTEYGNIAGTRCATDYVELPSILMEHFLTSPHVVSLFFDKPVAYEPNPLRTEPRLARINSHTHVLLASLDQHYHASLAPLGGLLVDGRAAPGAGSRGCAALCRGDVLAGTVRPPIRVRRELLLVPVRPRDRDPGLAADLPGCAA